MKNNRNIKNILVFSVFSGVLFISVTRASAIMKKTATSLGGATSSSLTRRTAMGLILNTWSSRRGKMNGNNDNGVSLESQKILDKPKFIHGKFINEQGDAIKLSVYDGLTKEGLGKKIVKTIYGEEVNVVHIGDGNYSKTLSLEEIKIYQRQNKGKLQIALDTLGRGRFVLTVLDDKNELAYQPDLGILREVLRGEDNSINLSHPIDVNSLTGSAREKVLQLIREISRYAAPLIGPTVSRKVQ